MKKEEKNNWYISKNAVPDWCKQVSIVEEDTGRTVALVYDVADASLLASAPELLKALEDLTNWGRDNTSPLDTNSPHTLLIAAVDAIMKAKGE